MNGGKKKKMYFHVGKSAIQRKIRRRRQAVLVTEPFSPVSSPSVAGRSGFAYVVASNLRALD